MNPKIKILIGILVVGVVLIGGWWIWNNQQIKLCETREDIEKYDGQKVRIRGMLSTNLYGSQGTVDWLEPIYRDVFYTSEKKYIKERQKISAWVSFEEYKKGDAKEFDGKYVEVVGIIYKPGRSFENAWAGPYMSHVKSIRLLNE